MLVLLKNNIKIFQPSRQPVLRGFHPRCHRNTLVLNPRLKAPSLSFMYPCHRRPKLMLELLVLTCTPSLVQFLTQRAYLRNRPKKEGMKEVLFCKPVLCWYWYPQASALKNIAVIQLLWPAQGREYSWIPAASGSITR